MLIFAGLKTRGPHNVCRKFAAGPARTDFRGSLARKTQSWKSGGWGHILIYREARLPGLAFGLEPVRKLVLERSCRNVFLEETLCVAGDACELLRFVVAHASVWTRGLPGLRVPSAACVALPVIRRMRCAAGH